MTACVDERIKWLVCGRTEMNFTEWVLSNMANMKHMFMELNKDFSLIYSCIL